MALWFSVRGGWESQVGEDLGVAFLVFQIEVNVVLDGMIQTSSAFAKGVDSGDGPGRGADAGPVETGGPFFPIQFQMNAFLGCVSPVLDVPSVVRRTAVDVQLIKLDPCVR